LFDYVAVRRRNAMQKTPTEITLSPKAPPVTPPATSGLDAEVDLELLKSVPKQFAVVDAKTANWVVRKIVSAREYADHIKQWATLETRRAEREEITLMFLFGRQLEAWSKAEIEKLGGRKKSLSLPAGTVGLRTEPTRLIVDDEDVVLTWVRHHLPDAVEIVEKLKKTILNDHFKHTGDVPDAGIHLEPEREKFYVRAGRTSGTTE
jgi:hypothetical protein